MCDLLMVTVVLLITLYASKSMYELRHFPAFCLYVFNSSYILFYENTKLFLHLMDRWKILDSKNLSPAKKYV